MYQVEMDAKKYLVIKVEKEAKSSSGFDMGGGRHDANGAAYKVVHAPAEGKYKADELVLLNPGSFSALYLNGDLLTKVNEDDIIAKLKEK